MFHEATRMELEIHGSTIAGSLIRWIGDGIEGRWVVICSEASVWTGGKLVLIDDKMIGLGEVQA